MDNLTQEQMVVKILRDCGAIFINTKEFFTYSSGIKSPIYCDNRVLISYPKERKIIANALASMIKEKFKDVKIIAATATGAIAHGAWIADILDLPMVYILSKSKTHGRQKSIEGVFNKNDKCVVIEDLISSGGSALAAVKTAKTQGLDVMGVASIFSYELNQAKSAFEKENCPFFSLSGFSSFSHFLSKEELEILNNWRNEQQ